MRVLRGQEEGIVQRQAQRTILGHRLLKDNVHVDWHGLRIPQRNVFTDYRTLEWDGANIPTKGHTRLKDTKINLVVDEQSRSGKLGIGEVMHKLPLINTDRNSKQYLRKSLEIRRHIRKVRYQSLPSGYQFFLRLFVFLSDFAPAIANWKPNVRIDVRANIQFHTRILAGIWARTKEGSKRRTPNWRALEDTRCLQE